VIPIWKESGESGLTPPSPSSRRSLPGRLPTTTG
jgi:hypothetical protein